ncbi:hypothetical protein ACQ4M3_29230 [Leptolyngbya sp. AN03gr2]
MTPEVSVNIPGDTSHYRVEKEENDLYIDAEDTTGVVINFKSTHQSQEMNITGGSFSGSIQMIDSVASINGKRVDTEEYRSQPKKNRMSLYVPEGTRVVIKLTGSGKLDPGDITKYRIL